MCIIACKPIGLQMPDADTIENMWYANPDGAGIMYNKDGRVQIEKGFMKLKDFMTALERISKSVDLVQSGVVMHFRITTHGGTKPSNTHPFPITDSLPVLKKLRTTTKIGMAHNGIISNIPREKDISDTMEFVLAHVAPLSRLCPNFLANEDARLLMKNAIGSGNKLAFLIGDGTIYTMGDFVNENGLLYSNHSYEDWYTTYRYSNYSTWDSKTKTWEKPATSTKPYALPEWDDDDDDYAFGYETDTDLDKFWTSGFVSEHKLVPLSDVDGAFYTDKDGVMYEDDNFDVYIDVSGRPWSLDVDTGLCFLDPTIYGVYNKDGNHLVYDYKLAEAMDCYDFYNSTGYYVKE